MSLEVISLSPNQSFSSFIAQAFLDFGAANTRWIVSQPGLKNEIEDHLLERTSGISRRAAVLANDFWREIFKQQNDPLINSYQLVSKDFLLESIAEHLIPEFPQLQKGSEKTILNTAICFSDVFFQNDLQDHMEDWLAENPLSQMKWGLWYLLAQKAHQLFQRQKITCEDLIFGLLNQIPNIQIQDRRRLIFCLGPWIRPLDLQLIKKIAENNFVYLVKPTSQLNKKFSHLLRPYDSFLVPILDESSLQ